MYSRSCGPTPSPTDVRQNFVSEIYLMNEQLSTKTTKLAYVPLVIFVGLIFRGLESSDDFVVLYFHGIPNHS